MMDASKRHPDYFAAPLPENIFEWHFTLRGPYQNAPLGGRSSPPSACTTLPGRRGEAEEEEGEDDGKASGGGGSPPTLSSSLSVHPHDGGIDRKGVGKKAKEGEEKNEASPTAQASIAGNETEKSLPPHVASVAPSTPHVEKEEETTKEVCCAPPWMASSFHEDGGGTPAPAPPPPSVDGTSAEEMFSRLEVYQEPGEGLLGYEKGLYHGALIFSSKFPFEPPDIVFFTPQGRFECHKKICSTISSFHKEHWQPTYHVGFILQSLRQFMCMESEDGIGALHKNCMTRVQKATHARQSWDYYCSGCQCHSFDTYRTFMYPYTMTVEKECHPAGGKDGGATPPHSTMTTPPTTGGERRLAASPLPPLRHSSSSSSSSLLRPQQVEEEEDIHMKNNQNDTTTEARSGGCHADGEGVHETSVPTTLTPPPPPPPPPETDETFNESISSTDSEVLFARELLSGSSVGTLLEVDPQRTREWLGRREEEDSLALETNLFYNDYLLDNVKERNRIRRVIQEAERCRRVRRQEAEATTVGKEDPPMVSCAGSTAAPSLSSPDAREVATTTTTAVATSFGASSSSPLPTGASSSVSPAVENGRVGHDVKAKTEKEEEEVEESAVQPPPPHPSTADVPWDYLSLEEWEKQLLLFLADDAKEADNRKGGTPPVAAAAATTEKVVHNIFATLDDDSDGPSSYMSSARVVFYLPHPRRALRAIGIGRKKEGESERPERNRPTAPAETRAPHESGTTSPVSLPTTSLHEDKNKRKNRKKKVGVKEEKGIPVTVHTLDLCSSIFCSVFLLIAIHKGVSFFCHLFFEWWLA